jgi:acyl-CoA thioesterase-1
MGSNHRLFAIGAALALVLVACGRDSAATATSTPTLGTPRPVLGLAPPPTPSPSPEPSPVPQRPLVYVAIGASDTVGVGAADPARDGWVPQLARKLGPGTRVRNLGVSGTLLETALRDQLPAAVQEQPDLVTIWLAVNDLNAQVPLDRYSAELNSLLRSLREETSARVLVANVPDLTVVPRYSGVNKAALRDEIERWNLVISDAARRHAAHVVDLFGVYGELAARPQDISEDGFHPSTTGYTRIADVFFRRPAAH